MKMKLLKVGADRFDPKNCGYYAALAVDSETRDMLAAFVGCDVEVTITPVLRFEIGDVVDYSNIIGEEPVLKGVKITDGPFVLGGTLCWRIEKEKSVVADAALRKHIPGAR